MDKTIALLVGGVLYLAVGDAPSRIASLRLLLCLPMPLYWHWHGIGRGKSWHRHGGGALRRTDPDSHQSVIRNTSGHLVHGNGSPGDVTVTANDAKETPFAYGPEGTSPAPWLSAANAYVFRLYSIAPKRRLLARLRIDQNGETRSHWSAIPPPMTSHFVDRVLQLLSFGWVALAALLASMYVIEVRRDR